MMKTIITIVIFVGILNIAFAQSRWTNSYLEGEDPYAKDIVKHYDDGFLLSGRYGPNYPIYCWLLKTDINGRILWQKAFGKESSYSIMTDDVQIDKTGSIYLAGATYYYSEYESDPIIMKLNNCGEKEWCKVFVEDGSNYVRAIVNTKDDGVVAILHYMNPDISKDRICLSKLSSDGELLWKQCYNSEDTCLMNQDAYDLIETPDDGFLITGVCQYQELNPPNAFRNKPYYIKTDSFGNFEWETVVHKGLKSPGGYAWTTILNTVSSAYYSALAHKYYDPAVYKAALLKLNLNGSVDTIYDLNTTENVTTLYEINFLNDSLIMGAATWDYGNTDDRKAVIIDTVGNIINSAHMIDDIYTTKTEVTFDKKLLYLTTTVDQNDNFSTYLFKLNQQLQSDTLYTAQYTYDSLCPYQITNDTIVQDNCGLIVGGVEINAEPEMEEIIIYPNPAHTSFTVQCSLFEQQSCLVEVMDMLGRKVAQTNSVTGISKVDINTTGWQKGLYLIRVSCEGKVISSERVVVE